MGMTQRLEGKPGVLRKRVGLLLIARVAQSVERSAVNRKVGGSNPPVSDIFCINSQPQLFLPNALPLIAGGNSGPDGNY